MCTSKIVGTNDIHLEKKQMSTTLLHSLNKIKYISFALSK